MAENKNVNPNSVKRHKGLCRVEFIANKDLIDEYILKGYNYKMIHEELVEQKKIRMSYPAFAAVMRKYKENNYELINNNNIFSRTSGKRIKRIKENNKIEQNNQNNQNEQLNKQSEETQNNKNKPQSSPPGSVSFTESKSLSDLVGDIKKKESN